MIKLLEPNRKDSQRSQNIFLTNFHIKKVQISLKDMNKKFVSKIFRMILSSQNISILDHIAFRFHPSTTCRWTASITIEKNRAWTSYHPQKKWHPLPFKCVTCKKKREKFHPIWAGERKKFDHFMMVRERWNIFSFFFQKRSNDKKEGGKWEKVKVDNILIWCIL